MSQVCGTEAVSDLQALRSELELYALKHDQLGADSDSLPPLSTIISESSSPTELKLARVMQLLCNQEQPVTFSVTLTSASDPSPLEPIPESGTQPPDAKCGTGIGEMNFALWDALSGCLDVVGDLEGVRNADDEVVDESEAAVPEEGGEGPPPRRDDDREVSPLLQDISLPDPHAMSGINGAGRNSCRWSSASLDQSQVVCGDFSPLALPAIDRSLLRCLWSC